jgi:hypothetical protein
LTTKQVIDFCRLSAFKTLLETTGYEKWRPKKRWMTAQ